MNDAALYILGVIVIGQGFLIYGLVQRLIMQAKLPKLKPTEVVDLDAPRGTEETLPTLRMRIKTGSQRIGI